MEKLLDKNKELSHFIRWMSLELMICSMQAYERTKDKEFYELAQWFGNLSKENK